MAMNNTTYSGIGGPEDITKMMKKLEMYLTNNALDKFTLIALIIPCAILIFIGTIGNILVCLIVVRKPIMRTSQNLFIINLALSDLLLCLFSTPFSLMEISVKFWPFGITICKLVLTLETALIFVSMFTIYAIAKHTHLKLLHFREIRNTLCNILKLLLIWLTAIILASPLYLYRSVETYKLNIPWLDEVKYCVELWPIHHGRGYYTIISIIIQYLLPIRILSLLCIRSNCVLSTARLSNALLISITFIFCISRLPLNLINIVADFYFPFKSDKTFRIVFAICRMAALLSACSNPLLYGWLNQDFRNEFKDIFISIKKILNNCFNCKNAINNNDNIETNANHRTPHIYCGPNTSLAEDNKELLVSSRAKETSI